MRSGEKYTFYCQCEGSRDAWCATISTRGPSSGGSRRCFAAPAMTCCARRSRGRSRASGTWMAPGGRCGRASARPAERCSPWRGSWSATAATEARSATATRTATLVPRTADRTMRRSCTGAGNGGVRHLKTATKEMRARGRPTQCVAPSSLTCGRRCEKLTHALLVYLALRLVGRCARRAQSGGLVSVTPLTRSRLKPCSTVSRCQTRHLDTPRHPSTPLDTARHPSTPLDTARHL